jgi:phage terminase large subunit
MSQLIASSKYFKPVLVSRHRYLLLYGGRSSSKSYTAAQKMAKMCKEEPNFRGVMVRQVYNTIKDSMWSKIQTVVCDCGWQDEFKFTKSPLEIMHIPTGNKIIARGLDDPMKLKSLDDPTVIWFEEALEIGEDAFVKVNTSIRSSKPNTLKQAIITFNPENEGHWLNKKFFPSKHTYEKDSEGNDNKGDFTYIKSIKENTLLMHSTYKHNDYCTDDDIETITDLLNDYDEEDNYVKVYVRGYWGLALKGLIFEKVNYVNDFPDKADCKTYGYGLDFGFTNDPTAVVECALAHGELWVRVLTHKTGLHNTINEKDKSIPSIEGEFERNEVSKSIRIIADSAEPKSISELQTAGYNVVGVDKSKDSIEGVLTQMKKYTINCVSSPSLEKEFKSYKYQEAKEGAESDLTNKPIDAWNHDIDAFRYWFMENVFKPQYKFEVW